MRRLALLLLSLVAVVTGAAAQQPLGEIVVTRNVNLRTGPSTADSILRTLLPPDHAALLDTAKVGGYYHVRSDEDEAGWVWSRNVARVQPDSTAVAVAGSIDPSWAKAVPASGTFTATGQTCGPVGDGGDSATNRRKNRTDTPGTYHDIAFDAVAGLPYPAGPHSRAHWPDSSLARLALYEGVGLRVVGYIVALKPQTGGSGESTNCHWTHAAEVDWHIALVGHAGDGEKRSVVVETTPRVRAQHPHWTVAALKPWLDSDAPVRISGWLMFDPEHPAHVGKYRGTLWEIHPITRIEVWHDGAWHDLDE